MAARRIAKSTVDWAQLGARVPENQQQFLRAFKARHDSYLAKVMSFPEEPPKIDWETYKARVPVSGLTEQFQKALAAIKVPYPEDKLSAQIDAQEQSAMAETKVFINESNERIEQIKADLKKWAELYPIHKMTLDEYVLAFPDHAWGLDQKKYQTMFPHDYDPRIGVNPSEEGSGLWNFGPNRKEDLARLEASGGSHH